MTKYSSRIEGLKLPVNIPQKGRGHKNVMADFSVGTSNFIEPEQFIPYFSPVANTTLSPSMLSDTAATLSEDFRVGVVELGSNFDYPLDRLSTVDYIDSMYSYNVGYQCDLTRKKLQNYVYASMPVVLNEITSTLANLTFVLGYGGQAPFFEDIIFSLEKNIVPLTPSFSLHEREELRQKLLNAKNAYGTITDLLDIYAESTYITSCTVEIHFKSAVLKTDIFHTAEWKHNATKY